MLTHYLQTANELLSDLIETTQYDIEDIKQAKHENVFSRTKTKEELVKSFENHKSLIDNEIAKMVKESQTPSLENLLDEEQRSLLDAMRANLQTLQSINKRFASMVISVSNFYSSLINRLIPTEQIGYDNHRAKSASYLQIKG